jgi:hypothetical protein
LHCSGNAPDDSSPTAPAIWKAGCVSAADAEALVRTVIARIAVAEDKEQQFARLINTHPSEQRRGTIEAEAAATRAEVQRLHEQRQERAARERLSGNLLGILRGFIGSLPPNTLLEIVPKSELSLRNGETVLGAITRVRGELAAAQCELMQLRAAPLPLDDLKQMATEAVSKFARPSLQVRDGRLDIGWPKDPVAFLAWVNAEQVVARLHEQIERLPVPANALSAAERNRRSAEINACILELEHEEEALVEAALEAGHDGVSRREVASPAVVLGVRVSTRARAAA